MFLIVFQVFVISILSFVLAVGLSKCLCSISPDGVLFHSSTNISHQTEVACN
jgi:hypothetical protein